MDTLFSVPCGRLTTAYFWLLAKQRSMPARSQPAPTKGLLPRLLCILLLTSGFWRSKEVCQARSMQS